MMMMVMTEPQQRRSKRTLVLLVLVTCLIVAGFGYALVFAPRQLENATCPTASRDTSGGGGPTQTRGDATVPSAPSATALGIIVPMYMQAGCVWTQLIQTSAVYPSVPVLAVVNPGDGVGSENATYAQWVIKLQHANITVYGYVDTKYAAAPISEVEANISDYASWYRVNGIFFDEMANAPGDPGYYASLSQYARSVGILQTLGDPGTSTTASYVGTVDNLMIYENPALPSASLIENSSMGYPRGGFSFVAYEVPTLPPQSYFDTVANYVSWVWVTDTDHSFQTLPSYLAPEMGEIAAAG